MDHKREHRTPPLARVMGVGRQQQYIGCDAKLGHHDETIMTNIIIIIIV